MLKLAQRITVRRLLGSWGSVLCLGLLLTSPTGAAEAPRAVSFVNDVVPVLTKAGCNSGACHEIGRAHV